MLKRKKLNGLIKKFRWKKNFQVFTDFLIKFINLAKKTLIFDLDETLVHCNDSKDIPSDVILTINFPTGETIEAFLFSLNFNYLT